MSRRKQAKPRAFLKLGDLAAEECESDPLAISHDTKEELQSDIDEQSQYGEDEDDDLSDNKNRPSKEQRSKAEQLTTTTTKTSSTTAAVTFAPMNNGDGAHVVESQQPELPPAPPALATSNSQTANVATLQESKQHALDPSEAVADDTATLGERPSDEIAETKDADARADADAVADNSGDGNKGDARIAAEIAGRDTTTVVANKFNTFEHFDENDIDEYEEEIDDEVDDYDDEDLFSLDSYYSDMYSTHTSSSYSPSISDGTITPNSLQHQHLQHLQNLQQLHDDALASAESETQRLRRQPNGEASLEGSEEHNGAEGDTKKRRTQNAEADNMALEQFKRHGRHQRHSHHHHHHHGLNVAHSLKIPTKLRKIDRDANGAGTGVGSGAGAGSGSGAAAAAAATAAGGAKFSKLTGEGIKNSCADGSYQCQFCEKSFPRLGYLKKHEQSHAEHLPFKCEYCARLFKHKRSRDRHTKLHTGDRRYRCPHCEAAFSRSDHLKIHMKTHDNQKPFQCTICNRGYNTAAALTSHMQNHKKQAAILAAGGNPQALNYSPRSTGSASSNGSLHKRRYAMAASAASDSSPSHHEYPSKRLRPSYMNCSYCGKSDFNSLDQLNVHMQSNHEKELAVLAASSSTPINNELHGLQLSCEYCTMKLPNIPALFQHMRNTHVDQLSSPNSYFEHFNRLTASGTFSPHLVKPAKTLKRAEPSEAESEKPPLEIKIEETQEASPKGADMKQQQQQQDEEPTDLSAKRRSESPASRERRTATPDAATQTSRQLAISPRESPTQQQKPDVFFCNQCNAGLPDFESFRNHLKTHITQGMNLVCHHCGLALRDHAEFERHIISHFLITNTEYNCSGNCNKAFQKPEELQKHLMDQHVATMLKCTLCSELFESKVSIQVHFACAHAVERKLLRCSACMEVFHSETDFNLHVKTRHQQVAAANANGSLGGSLQCMFCRTVCGSELEMHFHLAAHARQFRCPSCPETFHVEFLLDRHMQSQHGGNEPKPPSLLPNRDSGYEDQQMAAPGTPSSSSISPMNSLYVNALLSKATAPLMPLAAQNNNNSILDYNVAFAAAHLNKGLFPGTTAAASAANKFYNPLQVDTNTMKHHPALMYGLSQRYFDTNRTLLDMYTQQQQQQQQQQQHQQQQQVADKGPNFFISPKNLTSTGQEPPSNRMASDGLPPNPNISNSSAGFSCGICERNDFRTETEVHSHRKIVHNMKTGVSLRCAYCSGNFKSRSELEHHMKTCHNSTGKHKCLICDEIFPSPAILSEHKLQHSKVGQSGRCSHCSKPLNDIATFKEHLNVHNAEGKTPVQCICCRQSLHSEFEIGLHAKFHTKSTNMPENVCALCLEAMPHTSATDAKVCEKCCRKHNLNAKYHHHQQQQQSLQAQQQQTQSKPHDYSERGQTEQAAVARQFNDNRCNLCKAVLPHLQKLQEHLLEHTFIGCEERGFNCYICSAVFTAPAGLLQHMNEHGPNSRPYDCNLCTEKFYFRAELDHHLIDHELRDVSKLRQEMERSKHSSSKKPQAHNNIEPHEDTKLKPAAEQGEGQLIKPQEVKKELIDEPEFHTNANEEDEYIEVEQIPESAHNGKEPLEPMKRSKNEPNCEHNDIESERKD